MTSFRDRLRRSWGRPFPWALAAVVAFLLLRSGDLGFFRDGAHFYGPTFQYVFEEIRACRLPLWDPYENLGQPLAANPMTMLFYPGTWAALLAALTGLPVPTAYALYVAGHLLLAMTTAYRLARTWRCSRHAATLVAVCYALSGNVLFQWNNVPFLVGAAWFPEALRQAIRMFREASSRPVVGLACVLAMMVLGGDIQATYHAILCIAILGLMESRRPGRSAMRLSVAGGLAFLLAAVQILPAWELGLWSDRSLPAHRDAIWHFSVAPWRLLEFLWPNLYGRQFPVNARWLSATGYDVEIWVPSFYMGLLPIVLALCSSRDFLMRKKDAAKYVILAGFVPGALGNWFVVYHLLLYLPGYDAFRFPAKLLTVASLMLAVLAGRGFDRMVRDRMFRRLVLRTQPVLFVCAFFVAIFSGNLKQGETCPLFGPYDPVEAGIGLWFSFSLLLVLCLLNGALIYRFRRRSILIFLVLTDLFFANAWMLPAVPRKDTTWNSSLLAEMRSDEIAPMRIYRFPIWYPETFEKTSSPNRLAEAVDWDRASLFPRHTLPLRIDVVDVRGTLMPKDYYALAGTLRSEQVYAAPGVFERHLASLGVRYVVAPEDAKLDADRIPPEPGWPDDVSLWKIRDPAARDFVSYEPNRITFDLSLEKPGTVVVAEQFWPGWRAFRDDVEISIRKVDVFRGVELPAGEHRVTMVYDPPLLKIGAALSLAGLVTVTVCLAVGRRSTRSLLQSSRI